MVQPDATDGEDAEKPDTAEIPKKEVYELYKTLANATEAASMGDTNLCAEKAAEAKRTVMEWGEKYE